ncbi:family 16 glycosylhydrolase [Alsobacter sp. SYSU M60028]|uniref:Family 16 glycosylhydrolase n=1 Tax=Alsobacter ponti TaxID=2962936 RepID=A0ABT1L712_9HYPH|nr:family 16 glycosylhydrolase [Alsobacter ponti]MCP8937229.1 family 16 glycosylhydrolase [Alsobacter ponti]
MFTTGTNNTAPRTGMVSAFAQEFNGTELPDATHAVWNTVYPGNIRGGLNGEKQIYLDQDYRTSDGRTVPIQPFSLQGDGALTITGNPTPANLLSDVQNFGYTSGMINTYDQYQFKYGFFEIRCDIPGGKGTFPAFWLRNADSSVKAEIDIFEIIGGQPKVANQTVHTDDGSILKVNRTVTSTDFTQGFHTYGVDWQPDFITFYVDGQKTGAVATPDSLKVPMYLIANLALGGTWPGSPDATTPWPATMKIDYIRVWQDEKNLASVTLNGTASADKLFGNDGADVITAGDGNDTVLAAAGNDSLDGGAGDDRLIGGMGDDTISGGSGVNYLAGGVGNDTYIVNQTGDTFYEIANGGFDTVVTGLSAYTLTGYLDAVRYTGSGAFKGNGNPLANLLVSGAGADTLVGAAGDDTLDAGAGNDRMDGGTGKDVYVAGHGGQDFVVSFGLAEDRIDVSALHFTSLAEAINGATVNINGQVVLHFGAESLTLGGVSKVAQLTDAHFIFEAPAPAPTDTTSTTTPTTTETAVVADPTIYGTNGNDSLVGTSGNDRMDGLLGNDTLSGGAGDDVYVVSSAGKTIVEKSGGGTDTVETSLASYTLSGYVENLTYTGTGDFKGTGSGLANVITGGGGVDSLVGGNGNDSLFGAGGNDRLNGGAGADLISGGSGCDTLTGYTGADTFVFTAADGLGSALVTDFQRGYDHLDVHGMGLVDFADVLAHATTSSLGFATIANAGESFTLQNVKIADLQAADFIF